MPAETFTTLTSTDNSLSPSIEWYEKSKFFMTFKGNCLKQKIAAITSPNIIILLLLKNWIQGGLNSCFALKDCLLGGIKLAKSSDLD